jgi:ElaB/YqjD/DUF883 family membrane-anchored ribosome-binding protein
MAPTADRTQPNDPTSEAVEDLKDRAHDKIDQMGEQVERMAASTKQMARQMGDMAQQFRPTVERSLKEQPMATLAVAAALGFLLGALWKR